MFLVEFESVYIIATDLYLEHTLEKQNENPHGWDVLSRGLKSVLRTYPKPILRTFRNLYLEHPSGEPMGTIHIYIYMCVCVFEVQVRVLQQRLLGILFPKKRYIMLFCSSEGRKCSKYGVHQGICVYIYIYADLPK